MNKLKVKIRKMKSKFIIISLLCLSTLVRAQLKVTSDGNVGIKTTLPNAKLDLGSTGFVAGNPLFLMYNDNTTGILMGTKVGFYADNFGNNNLNLVFAENASIPGFFTICGKSTVGTTLNRYFTVSGLTGFVGIGSSNPTAKLDVQGYNVRFSNYSTLNFYTNNSDPRICSASSKIIFFKSDNSDYINIECKNLVEYSDSVMKTNITQLDGSLNKILKLNGYTYNWKNDIKDSKKQSGLLAQQVERVIPEVVTKIDSTGGKMLSYTHLVPYLIEAIKEQQNQIAGLNEKITALENTVQSCCNSSSKTKSYTESEPGNNSNTISSTSVQIADIKLYQNAPNPFKLSTNIKMDIPQSVGTAMVCIYDLNGRQLKCLPVTERGNASVLIYGNELTAGMYHYVLIADGNLIDTKKMILKQISTM